MNVLYLAFFIDDDPDGNRIESALGKDRINSLQYIFGACVAPDAYRDIIPARPGGGIRLSRQVHLVHFLDEILRQLDVTAGEDELDQVAADLGRQHVPV